MKNYLSETPASYHLDEVITNLYPKTVKGEIRRQVVAQAVGEDQIDIADPLVQSELTESDRQDLGRLHPAMMGGEYLPTQQNNEIEICRICIRSTTFDVVSVRCRKINNQIHLEVFDEYGGDTLDAPTSSEFEAPLSLGDLLEFIFGVWNFRDVLSWNFDDLSREREEVHNFIVSASSDFYPHFANAVHDLIDTWIDD